MFILRNCPLMTYKINRLNREFYFYVKEGWALPFERIQQSCHLYSDTILADAQRWMSNNKGKPVFGLIMICRQALKIPRINTSKWKKVNIILTWQVIDELTKRLKRDDEDRELCLIMSPTFTRRISCFITTA